MSSASPLLVSPPSAYLALFFFSSSAQTPLLTVSARFGVASNYTQFVTYEKVAAEEKEIAPLARKRLPLIKPAKEPSSPVPAAAAPRPATPETEKKAEGALGDKKERLPKREKPAAKPSAKPDGAATGAPAAAAKPAAAAPTDAQRGQPPVRQQGGQQHQQRRDAPKTQEHEATTLFRSVSRLQNKYALCRLARQLGRTHAPCTASARGT